MTLEEAEELRILNLTGTLRLPKLFQSLQEPEFLQLNDIRYAIRELMVNYTAAQNMSQSSLFLRSVLRTAQGVEKFYGAGTKDFPFILITKWGKGKFFNARYLFKDKEYPNYIQKRYCFSNCYYYAKEIGETNNKACKVLSGIAFVNKISILHTVIETSNGWIIDFNYDLVMQKDLYFSIFGFETLSELTSQEIFVKDRLLTKYEKHILAYGHGYRVFALDNLLDYAEMRANEECEIRLAIGNF